MTDVLAFVPRAEFDQTIQNIALGLRDEMRVPDRIELRSGFERVTGIMVLARGMYSEASLREPIVEIASASAAVSCAYPRTNAERHTDVIMDKLIEGFELCGRAGVREDEVL